MTPTHQDTRDFIIIADEKRRDLFELIATGDEFQERHTHDWIKATAINRYFDKGFTYRRHRSRAWLRIADKPVEFPCWIKHKDDGDIRWFDRNVWSASNPSEYGFTHWQPADPAPDAPVDEEDFEKWFVAEPWDADLFRHNIQKAWQAGRDYQKGLHKT